MSNATREELLAAREPEGPAPVGVWKLLRGHREDPLQRWTHVRDTYGDVARYRYGVGTNYLVTHPDGLKRVLQDNAGNYTKRHPTYAMIRRLVGNGLLTSEGPYWLRQRRLAQPAFHRARIAAMAERMVRAAERTRDAWEARAASGAPFSMLEDMSALTLQVVGEALFGTRLAAKTEQVRQAWDTLNAQFVERYNRRRFLPPVLPTRSDRAFRAAHRAFFSIVDELVQAKRREGGAGEDLLSMLVSARDADTGEAMSDAQLRDEVVTLLLAGHETTALALGWAWALLDQHPRVAERLRDELARELQGRSPTFADLPRLAHTRHVVDEVLRLYPPAYIFFRRVEADDVVCGARVRKGGTVVVAPMALHRHPAYWEDPDAFRPERWADEAAVQRRPRFAYLPFSAGPRQCIGNTFALTEAVLLLATLAPRFRPRLVDGYTLRPEYLTTLRPSGGLPMRLERAAVGAGPRPEESRVVG
ncbi:MULTISPECIES: cytochrome P450 [Myxococcaceae]|uniref:cytochrome P450 n=1 Tax=Myxococcaceae TaxID=31 RepID=UPI00188F1EE3|nr:MULTISPECIES: cytochrome P450 [Myxococcaceae]MBF5043377.1 cytochrome P450 [Simulacricoccus sp. 17bor-14]